MLYTWNLYNIKKKSLSVAWIRSNKAHSFPKQHLHSAFAGGLHSLYFYFHLPAAFSFQHLQGLQAEFKKDRFSPGWKGRKCSWADQQLPEHKQPSCGAPWAQPARAAPSPCHSTSDPVFACALPQLSESLDLHLLFWPLTFLPAQTSSVICSFVPVTILSCRLNWPSTTQTEGEGKRENFIWSIEWLKSKKFSFIFFKQVTCLTCIGLPLDLIDSLVPMVNLRGLST